MNCGRCRGENPPQARFCMSCGAALGLACASCGTELPAGAAFCFACGRPIGAGSSTPRFGSPDAYTPKHLVERILTSKAALEGERKQVTVLFADLKGSMELLADRDPEEARAILDPVLERMMEAVHRYEGTVNQVMGDGIMALFGAPLAHEDHAVRACYAALRMQESVKRYADGARRAHGVNVQIRVGLHSGDVVVRAIGSDLRMDYSAVGQTTHLAGRMEQLASPGSILATPATLGLVEGFVAVKPLGPVPVKGLAEPVEIYEVTGAGPARTRLQATARRGLTRFVGRDVELEALRRARQQAADGEGQIVAIVGEAGVGKSRLIFEFTHSHRLEGWLVLEAAAASYGTSTSYAPVIDLLKSYFTIQERDDERATREKVTGKLLTLDRALEPALPAVLALLDALGDDGAWLALDPAQRRRRILEAVRGVLLRQAREAPLLLIVEDLHWVDAGTQAVLDMLVESLGSARMLVLVNYRPEYRHPWAGKPSYSQVRLDPLAADTSAALLDVLLGDDPGLADLKERLAGSGNPFFLEETIRALAEALALVGERGRYRLARPLHAIQIPPTVQAVLAARIDRLAPEDKRLLQVASVVGRDVPFALLEAAAELSEEALREGLERLQAAEFLYASRLFPDLEYSFKHALTHDVTYANLLGERRRGLHRRILEALEGRPGARPAEDLEPLARHALGAEAWDRAVGYLQESGRHAVAHSAYQAAAERLERALEALTRLPDSRQTLTQAIDVRLDLRVALVPLGKYERVLALMREAEALATRLGDRARLGFVLADMCARLRNVGGEHREAVEVGRRALAIAEELGDRALQAEARYRTGQAYFAVGDYRQAIDLLSASTASARVPLFGSWAGSWLALSLANLGRFAEAVLHAEHALRIAEECDHPFTVAEALASIGGVRLVQGDFESAIRAQERAIAVSREWKLRSWAALSRLGYAYALAGRISEARGVLEDVVQSAATLSLGVGRALQLAWLGETYVLDGRFDDAEERGQEALSLARRHHERGHEACALRLLGEVASRRVPARDGIAAERYREAMALARDLGMRPLVAHCHLGLGRLHARMGKRQEAGEHLTAATTLYRDMDMRHWLDHAQSEVGR